MERIFQPNEKNLLNDDDLEYVIDKVVKNTSILIEIFNQSPRFCDQVLQKLYNNDDLINVMYSIVLTNGKKAPKKIYELAYKYIPIEVYEYVDEDTIYNTKIKTFKRLLGTYNVTIPSMNSIQYEDALTNLVSRLDLDTLLGELEGNEKATALKTLMLKSDCKLLKTLSKFLFDGQIDGDIACAAIVDDIISNPKKYNIADEIIETIYNKSDNKSYIKDKIKQHAQKNQYFDKKYLNYIDNVDENAILTLIGNYYNENDMKGLEKFKKYLIEKKQISPKLIKQLENYYIQAYEHGLDDDIVFD